MSDKAKRLFTGTIIAAAAGYVAGILTAPKSGKETRKDIKDVTVHGMNEAEKQLKKLHTELNDVIAEAKEKATKLSGVARQDLDAAIELTKQVKEKAREILSAVHEGDAEDKELKKAIKDAQSAVDNLKTYLKKRG